MGGSKVDYYILLGISRKEYKILKNKKNVSLIRKYCNDINWWVEVERYRNGKIAKVLSGEIIQTILSIDGELRRGYQLKELFLDIINHTHMTMQKDN